MFGKWKKAALIGELFLVALAGTVFLWATAFGIANVKSLWDVQTTPSDWVEVDLGGAISSTIPLVDVFMLDADNAWIIASKYPELEEPKVGRGIVYRLHRENDRWLVADSYNLPYLLNTLFAVSETDVWVVGTRIEDETCCPSVILHMDVAGWHEIPKPLPNAQLQTIQMSADGKEGWIGGTRDNEQGCAHNKDYCYDALLLRYQSGEWHVDNSIQQAGEATYTHSFDFAEGGGYAAGSDALLRYDGTKWTREELPPPLADCGGMYYSCTIFRALDATSREDAWAVGRQNITLGPPGNVRTDGVVLHRTTGRWQRYQMEALDGRPEFPKHVTYYNDLSFGKENYGVLVGSQTIQFAERGWPYIASYGQDGRWHYENAPYIEGGSLTAVSTLDSIHALAIGEVRDSRGWVLKSFVLSKRPWRTWLRNRPDSRALEGVLPLPSESK